MVGVAITGPLSVIQYLQNKTQFKTTFSIGSVVFQRPDNWVIISCSDQGEGIESLLYCSALPLKEPPLHEEYYLLSKANGERRAIYFGLLWEEVEAKYMRLRGRFSKGNFECWTFQESLGEQSLLYNKGKDEMSIITIPTLRLEIMTEHPEALSDFEGFTRK